MRKSHIQSLGKNSNKSWIRKHQTWSHLGSVDYSRMLTCSHQKRHIPCQGARQGIPLVWENKEQQSNLLWGFTLRKHMLKCTSGLTCTFLHLAHLQSDAVKKVSPHLSESRKALGVQVTKRNFSESQEYALAQSHCLLQSPSHALLYFH